MDSVVNESPEADLNNAVFSDEVTSTKDRELNTHNAEKKVRGEHIEWELSELRHTKYWQEVFWQDLGITATGKTWEFNSDEFSSGSTVFLSWNGSISL
jgi:hypothetical protein